MESWRKPNKKERCIFLKIRSEITFNQCSTSMDRIWCSLLTSSPQNMINICSWKHEYKFRIWSIQIHMKICLDNEFEVSARDIQCLSPPDKHQDTEPLSRQQLQNLAYALTPLHHSWVFCIRSIQFLHKSFSFLHSCVSCTALKALQIVQ